MAKKKYKINPFLKATIVHLSEHTKEKREYLKSDE